MGAGKPIGESFQPGRDYSVGGQIYSGTTGQVIGEVGRPGSAQIMKEQIQSGNLPHGDNLLKIQRERERERMRYEQERQRQERQLAFQQQKDQVRNTFQRAGTRTTSPGASNTPVVPAPRPEYDSQAALQEAKSRQAQMRAEQEARRQEAKQLQAAQREKERLYAQEKDRLFQERLNQEKSQREAARNVFGQRIQEIGAEASRTPFGGSIRRPSMLKGSERQAQMQAQFEQAKARAAAEGKQDVVRQLEQEEAAANQKFEQEGGFSLDAYDEILNRLRQYRRQ